MCGRYGNTFTDKELIERFDAESFEFEIQNNYNVTPTQEEPVIERHSPNSVHLRKWGIFPSFMKGGVLINAQAEKLAHSPVWKRAFLESRCIVPFSYFYEWKVLKKGKQPYLIHLKNKELMGFAGLVVTTKNKDGEEHTGYVIITTEANPLMREIHNTKHRMPVILEKKDEDDWLNPDNADPDELMKLLKQYPESRMEAYPVSSLVNKPSNNSEEITERITI
jgi:putative SOS response-associated peptidase YedK